MVLNIGQLNAQTNDFTNSLNSYSFDLYRETKIEKENLFLSPLSTYYALLVAYEGSRNKTKQEFEKVLYLQDSGPLKNDYLQNIISKSDNNAGLKISNAIWLDKSLQTESRFRKSVTNKYFSDFKQTEFANTQLAVSDINQWVSEKTNKGINNIVSTSKINADTRMLISNVVYFKGEWLNTFKKRNTHSDIFFASIEDQYKIDFMENMEILQYFENEEYQFISKPYKNSGLSFCIILPKKLFGMEEIEKKMNNDFLMKIMKNSYDTKTKLFIPKIKLEANYELSNVLKNAGLNTAFTKEADFSGITKETPLMLAQILHKTWIELDEEKTEAAAATATTVMIGSATLAAFKVFKADHPFVFFVIDNTTRTILFMGRYVEPLNGEKIIEDKESLALKVESRKQEKITIGNVIKEILIVVNKKIITQAEFDTINPHEIESMEVVKNKEEIRKYSPGDYDSALIITLKKRKNIQNPKEDKNH